MRYLSILGRKLLFLIQSGLPALFMVALMSGIACASGGGHGEEHGSKLVDFAWRAGNFFVLAFLLYKFAWGKIKGFFAERREGIKAQLEEAVAAKEAAEKKFKEYSERLAKATEEIDQISEMIKSQGRVEKEKIVENAKLSAAKMKEDARARMEQDLKSASNHLRAEAAELSVKMAEDILVKTIKETDHDLMVTEFLNRMVTRN